MQVQWQGYPDRVKLGTSKDDHQITTGCNEVGIYIFFYW